MRPVLLALVVVVAACGDDTDYFTEAELMDPQSCMSCHPAHYREWSGSMHAYAADDPVFLAMNALGQEETDGELGDFCVNCHAPIALRLGLTTDGLNLDDVPQYAKGVTCFFCHSAAEVGEDHNNDITLASDQVLRAGLSDPVASPKHRLGYSSLVDVNSPESSRMCGSCHDLVTPAGVHLERTFEEWKPTIFASEDPRQHLSCGRCHMNERTDVAAEVEGVDVPLRDLDIHDHTFASVDVAVTDWPEKDAQLAAMEPLRVTAVSPRICVTPDGGGRLDYRLDNLGAGHMLPSGAAHDRRVWAEIHVYDAGGVELFAAGVVPEGVDPDSSDPDLWELRDFVTDEDDQPVHFFWEVRNVTSQLLAPTVTVDPLDPRFDHSSTRSWNVSTIFPQIARVTAALRFRAMPFELIDDLEASGHLTIDIRDQLPTFTLAELEWRPQDADLGGCVNP